MPVIYMGSESQTQVPRIVWQVLYPQSCLSVLLGPLEATEVPPFSSETCPSFPSCVFNTGHLTCSVPKPFASHLKTLGGNDQFTSLAENPAVQNQWWKRILADFSARSWLFVLPRIVFSPPTTHIIYGVFCLHPSSPSIFNVFKALNINPVWGSSGSLQ